MRGIKWVGDKVGGGGIKYGQKLGDKVRGEIRGGGVRDKVWGNKVGKGGIWGDKVGWGGRYSGEIKWEG